MKTKSVMLKEAIKKFENSERNNKDYLDFMVVVVSCFKQGSGLVWSHAQEIIDDALLEFFMERNDDTDFCDPKIIYE